MLLNAFKVLRRVASKEVTLFFSSPVAYIFLAAFAAVSLFVFFWGCLLYTSPSPRDQRGSRMPSSA